MRRRPRLYTAIGQTLGAPVLLAGTAGFLLSQTGSQPLPRPSAYDQVGWQVWEKVPLPIMGVVAVEGVDYPFRSRIWVDNAQRNHRKRWLDRARAAQPAVGPVPLVLIAPVDTTPLFTGNRDETPLGWAVRQKRRRALVAATPATWQWGARMGAYLPATVYPDTSCRIYSEIQRHLLENPIDDGVTWSLWTIAEVSGYLTQRINRFMVDSGLIRERRSVAAAAGQVEVDLPADTLEVMRTVWNTGAVRGVLIRSDKWALDNGLVGWQSTTGTPEYYVEEANTALAVMVAPPPALAGTLELVIIASPPVVRDRCYPLPLPAIFTPYLKWGVLADMLSKEGEAQDPERSEYCESRYQEGVELAKLFFAGRV